MKSYSNTFMRSRIIVLLTAIVLSVGCIRTHREDKTAVLLKTETAEQADLMKEVNRFARVNSMRAKMDLKFEDNSFAEFGSKEVYRQADGEAFHYFRL